MRGGSIGKVEGGLLVGTFRFNALGCVWWRRALWLLVVLEEGVCVRGTVCAVTGEGVAVLWVRVECLSTAHNCSPLPHGIHSKASTDRLHVGQRAQCGVTQGQGDHQNVTRQWCAAKEGGGGGLKVQKHREQCVHVSWEERSLALLFGERRGGKVEQAGLPS